MTDHNDLVSRAADHGMLVKLKIGEPSLGWVYCGRCGWGKGSGIEDRDFWLVILDQYLREPWRCAPCMDKHREAKREP
jgi:hypothetical protein